MTEVKQKAEVDIQDFAKTMLKGDLQKLFTVQS